MQLKGRRKVQSTLIEKTAKAMNEGDAYLLYSRDTLYVFYGQEANRMVRFFFFLLLPLSAVHQCANFLFVGLRACRRRPRPSS